MRSYGSAAPAAAPAPGVEPGRPRVAASSSAWLGETQEPHVVAEDLGAVAQPPPAAPKSIVTAPLPQSLGGCGAKPQHPLQQERLPQALMSGRGAERSTGSETAALQQGGRGGSSAAVSPGVSPAQKASSRQRPPLASRLDALRSTPATPSAPARATSSPAGFPASSRARRVAAAAVSSLGPDFDERGAAAASIPPDAPPAQHKRARGAPSRVRFADTDDPQRGEPRPPRATGGAAANPPHATSMKRRRDSEDPAADFASAGRQLALPGCSPASAAPPPTGLRSSALAVAPTLHPQAGPPPSSRDDAGYTSEELEA